MEKYEAFIKSYYQGNIIRGRKFLEEITSDKKYEALCNSVLWNAQFYISKSPSELLFKLKPSLYTEKSEGQKMFAINPFLIQDKITKQYILGVRTLNYAGNDGIEGMIAQGKIITRYEIYILNDECDELLKCFPLSVEFNSVLVGRDWPYATGTEDYRVIHHPSKDLFTAVCTGIETHEEGPVRMCTFSMKVERDKDEKEITGLKAFDLIPLKGYGSGSQQKNWIPIYINEKLHMIYLTTPFILLSVSKEGFCEEIMRKENQLYRCKNSTPFIPFSLPSTEGNKEDGFLTIVHISVDHEGRRVYYHRILFFNHNFELKKFSPLFYFEKAQTIEFASGFVHDSKKKKFFISFGFRDRFAYLHEMKEEILISLLLFK